MSDAGPTVFKGRYELHRRLARGGMSDVYLARDQVLDRPVAVKVLFPEFAKDETFVERFRREAKAAARLNHPNIVAIYDWGEELGTYFIAMEYVEGRTLSEMIRTDGPFEARRAAEITADVAGALDFAHRNGVVHRDVKPGNVLVDATGQVKVADFGIAQAAHDEQANLTRAGSVMGTAAYFSPEQAQGRPVDQRSDVYSLGCVLFEMLAGRPPFSADTPVAIAYKHVQEAPPSLASAGAAAPPELDSIVMTCLAKQPAARYSTAEELRDDLQRFLGGQPVAATAMLSAVGAAAVADATTALPATGAIASTVPPAGVVPPHDEPPKRGNGVFIGVLIVLLIALGVALFYIGSNLSARGTDSQVTVPTVVDLPVEEATRLLTDAGFQVERIDEPNDQRAEGIVFDQDPKGQASADEGSKVTIRVSAGLGDVAVPDVVRQDETTALATLTGAGFEVITEREASEDVPAGLVISQSPVAGTEVARGSKVTILVSTGKAEVEIPDVTGQTATAAANRLGQLGFQTKTTQEASDGVPAGRVIRTSPGAGSKAAPGATITIVVSTGPATTTTSSTTTTSTSTSTTSTTSTTTSTTSTTSTTAPSSSSSSSSSSTP